MIGKALELAIERHRGQTDKGGLPYLGHLLRVAARVADDEDAMTVALLHDIVEDTPTTYEELLALGFSPAIVASVRMLTKQPELSYMQNIKLIRADRLATKVKIADLTDNLDPTRPSTPLLEDGMLERYRKALAFLENKELEDGPEHNRMV
jgi:(p)ppGpp synthase/HD superfamily hydrolase